MLINRRRFFALSALTSLASGPLSRSLFADTPGSSSRRRFSAKESPLYRLLATPQIGFPTVTPTFAAMFTPGSGPSQLVRSETWDDFTSQTQTMAGKGFVLSALTSLQSLNRTWFYGAFQKGSGNYYLLRTPDATAFQQAFTQRQSTYALIDFDIAWELGQLYYTGYWLASAQNPQQTMLSGLDYRTLMSQYTNLTTKQGLRMTRIQAYPVNADSQYSALFVPGSDAAAFADDPIAAFATDVTGKSNTNSLVDVAYEPTSGNLLGCWRKNVTPSQYVFNQDWNSLQATAQQASSGGMVLTAMAAYPNSPSFDDFFETNLGPYVQGYAYAVAKDGQIIGSGGGFARSAAEKQNPSVPYTPDTRMTLASSSKAITGIALEVLLTQQKNISLDTPFWPLIQSKVPKPDPSVKTVTLRNLATMTSGINQPDSETDEGPLSAPPGMDIWSYIANILAQPLSGTPGKTYHYYNTNFTILQAVIELLSGMSYPDYVTKYILVPAGIDTRVFSATPDPANTATLDYTGASDTAPGYYVGPLSFVAPGGWVSSARELVKVLAALRGASILPPAVVDEMFADGIGWYSYSGNFGTYYHHNGGITHAAGNLNTCVVRLGEGYDIAVLTNSTSPIGIVALTAQGFDSRGVSAGALPANGPSLTTVVNGASFLPMGAPGSHMSVIGAGLPGPEAHWDSLIGPSGNLPTELNGVEVRVGSQYAYVEYAGPTQINFLLPSTVPAGIANVEVTTPAGGMTSSVMIQPVAPGLFAYRLNNGLYPAALIAGTGTVVAAAGALSGSTSRPARAGDFIELYGTGMGPTNTTPPDGVVFTKAYPVASLAAFKVTVGGKPANVTFAGLVGPGLFQIDVQIPTGLAGGDQSVTLSVGGVSAQPNLQLTIAA